MRNCRYNRVGSTLVERRVSLNNVILPPISPNFIENAVELYNEEIRRVNKSKSPSVNGDLVSQRQTDIPPKTPSTPEPSQKPADASRVAQLEQNIKFLQEQHLLMLSGLHQEIDNLRHRNRELQFQLIFAKGPTPSSPSSPEDDAKPKAYYSPKQLNITPLQVEILERELSELKINLQEIETRNVYLSAIADEQKKKLERYERDRERERERGLPQDQELLRKLEDAEQLIRRLRQENSELKRDNSASASNSSSTTYTNRENGASYQRGNASNGSNRGGPRHRGNYRGNWFPPLHSQSYWHNGRASDRNSSSSGENTSLPSLQTSGSSSQYHGRRGANNNHYHNSDGRKYRGGQNRSHKPS